MEASDGIWLVIIFPYGVLPAGEYGASRENDIFTAFVRRLVCKVKRVLVLRVALAADRGNDRRVGRVDMRAIVDWVLRWRVDIRQRLGGIIQ